MHSVNPAKLINGYWQHRQLIKQLVNRVIASRYQGTYLGFLWVIFDPLLMLTVYTFVFRVIFNRHWYSTDETIVEFGIILFSGFLIFNIFRDTITKKSWLVIGNANYVKKIVFPLEILSRVSFLSGFFHLCVSFLLLLAIYLIVNAQLHIAVLINPLILFPLIIVLFGANFFLSSLGVYFRDVSQVIGMGEMKIYYG